MNEHRPEAKRTSDDVAFEFGGRLCLDFTWTLRYRAVHPTDLLARPENLTVWLSAVGLPAGRVTPSELDAARQFREAIYAAALDTVVGYALRPRHLTVINRWAAAEPAAARLRPDGTKTLAVRRGHETAAGLTLIAGDAVDLLSSGESRIRRCEGPNCSLLFHDRSRPGTRRWCSAERCGNKINTKNYRASLNQ